MYPPGTREYGEYSNSCLLLVQRYTNYMYLPLHDMAYCHAATGAVIGKQG